MRDHNSVSLAFLKTLLMGAVGASLIGTPVPAASPRKPAVQSVAAAPSSNPAVCASLAADYENASKKLARSKAENEQDDSAIRANQRATEDGNAISQATMTMTLMKSNGCNGPTYAPNPTRYFSAADKCAHMEQAIALTARVHETMRRQGLATTSSDLDSGSLCDMTQWMPDN